MMILALWVWVVSSIPFDVDSGYCSGYVQYWIIYYIMMITTVYTYYYYYGI